MEKKKTIATKNEGIMMKNGNIIINNEVIMTKKEVIMAIIASIIFWPTFYYFLKLLGWLLLKSQGMI